MSPPVAPRPAAWAFGLGLGLWAAVVYAALVPAKAVFGDGDPLTHAAIGRAVWHGGGLPATDPLVIGSPAFRDHEWFTDVMWYAILGLGGPGLLATVTVFLAGLTVMLLGALTREKAGGLAAFVAVAFAAEGLLTHLQARPHLFTWALLIAGRLGLHRGPVSPASIGAWVLLGVVWGNLHGGFLPGALLLGACAFREEIYRQERLLIAVARGAAVALAILIGAVINPVGPQLHVDVVMFLRDTDVLSVTHDFQPPRPGHPSFPAFIALLVLTLSAVFAGWRSLKWVDGLWVLGALAVAWSSGRNVPLMALWLAPELAAWWQTRSGPAWDSSVIAENAPGLGPALTRLGRRLDGFGTRPAWVSAGVLLCVIGAGWSARGVDGRQAAVPVDGLMQVCGLPGPDVAVFAVFHWGGYVAWSCPDKRVYAHPLTANYEGAGARMRTYGALLTAPADASQRVQALGVNHVWLPPHEPLTTRLREAQWSVVYEDADSVVLAAPKTP